MKFKHINTFTKDKVTVNSSTPVTDIHYENYKLKDIVSSAVDTLEMKDNRSKALVTFACTSFITLASKVPMSRIANLECDVLKSNVLNGLEMFTGANYQIPGPLSLGVGPTISASILLSLLKQIFSKLEDELSEIYNPHKLRTIKRGLTFLIALAQSLVLTEITGGGTLLACVMAIGATLMGVITDFMTDHGLINGSSAVIGSNIISQLVSSNLKSTLLTPFMLGSFLRLQSAHIRIPTRNRKGRKGYIPFKIFNGGVMPIILASSVVSLVAFFVPSIMLKFSTIVIMIQAMMIYLLNICETKVMINTKTIDKELRRKSIGIVKKNSKERPIDILDETASCVTNVSGIFLAVIGILPMIFGTGTFVNVTSIFTLSGVIYELIRKFKTESIVKNRRGFLN